MKRKHSNLPGKRRLKVGVLGARRGQGLARTLQHNPHAECAAVCDFDSTRLDRFMHGEKGLTAYDDFDRFLAHDCDAVIIAGYLPDHATQTIQALRAGKHVLCEVSACMTLAEGVALCREVEKSDNVYMFAENVCYTSCHQEVARLYRAGRMGEYSYGEGEYVHDLRSHWHKYTSDPNHWRNWLPSTYYSTHSLGPFISITGTRPVRVTGAVVPNRLSRAVGRTGDDWGLFDCVMDNGAVTHIISWSVGPGSSTRHRFFGTRGMAETRSFCRPPELRVYLERRGKPPRQEKITPAFRKWTKHAGDAGHGGCDLFVVWEFIEAIVKGKESPIDVYQAMDMTLPGILAYRSALKGGAPMDVPDFRRESVRKKYERDHLSPDPCIRNKKHRIPCSVLGKVDIPDSVHRRIDRLRREHDKSK